MLSFIGGSPVTSSKEQQGLYSCNPSCVTTVSYNVLSILTSMCNNANISSLILFQELVYTLLPVKLRSLHFLS